MDNIKRLNLLDITKDSTVHGTYIKVFGMMDKYKFNPLRSNEIDYDKDIPDIIVCDPSVTGNDRELQVDVFSYIEAVRADARLSDALIIMISNAKNQGLIDLAFRVGIDYWFHTSQDPKEIIKVMKTLIDINEEKKDKLLMESIMSVDEKRVELKSKIETDVSETIKKIGVPPHIKGYNYLRESIMMSIYDPSNLQYITKNLYPGIAKRYNSTVTSVERAIRHAIATAWDRNRTDVITEMFGYNNAKPTNSEFIATFADNFRLKYRLNLI